MLYTGKSLRSTVYKRKELLKIKFSLEYGSTSLKFQEGKALCTITWQMDWARKKFEFQLVFWASSSHLLLTFCSSHD